MNDQSFTEIREILDRVKRIETRVTITGRHVGADVGGGRPQWVAPGKIKVPTRNCSIGELVRVIPRDWVKTVQVYLDEEYLFTLADCQ